MCLPQTDEAHVERDPDFVFSFPSLFASGFRAAHKNRSINATKLL